MSNINTDNLVIGQTVKNYKELCSLLKLPVITGGDSKRSQLKEMKRYFEWEKSGQKFIITDIYDRPLPKDDGRSIGNNAIYIKYIEAILLRYLSMQIDYTCTLKKRDIWKVLGMINNKYQAISNDMLKKKDSRITSYQINHFYQRCNQKLHKILFSALDNLKNRCLITYYKQTVIVHEDYTTTVACDEEIKNLDAAKKRVLDGMGLDSLMQVLFRFKGNEFYSKLNDLIFDIYKWRYTFNQIKMIYTPENIAKALDDIDIELEKINLNQKILETIDAQANNNYKRQLGKFNELKKEYLIRNDLLDFEDWVDDKDIDVFKYPDHYIYIQQMLSNELLDIVGAKIVGEDNSKLSQDEEMLFDRLA